MDRRFWLGVLAGLACAVIWGGQAVVSRISVVDGLTTADVTVARFLAAGLVLLPFAWRNRPFPVGTLGWRKALILTALAGAPYSLVLVGGSAFSPALHAAVITPGLIPILAMALAAICLGTRPTVGRLACLALIAVGVALFGWEGLGTVREGAWRGQLLFVAAALMWAVFGTLTTLWRPPAILITTAVCLLSVASLPIWILLFPMQMGQSTGGAILLQAGYQGVLVGALSLFLYARSVEWIGPVRASLFVALVPVVACIAAALILDEQPTGLELAGMAAVIGGMTLSLRTQAGGNGAGAAGGQRQGS